MTIPFLHRHAAGVYATWRHVYWVDLYTFRRRVTRIRCATEPVADGEVGAALRRLAARLKPQEPDVSTHIHPLYLRHAVRRGPVQDADGVHAAWVQAQAGLLLPPGAPPEDFAASCAVLDPGNDAATCLLAVARRDALDACVEAVEASGLRPVRVGSADAEIGHVLAFDEAFVRGRTAVLVLREEDATLVAYRDGRLEGVSPLVSGAAAPEQLVEEVARRFAEPDEPGEAHRPDRVFVAGVGVDGVVALLAERGLFDGPVLPGTVSLRGGAKPLALPASHAPAAALALRQLYPELQAVDFLEGTAFAACRERVEKADALRVLLALGGLLAALLLVAGVASALLDLRMQETEEQLLRLAGRMEEVERGRALLEGLEADVRQAERLVSERTDVAGLLGRIGRAAPPALWLEAVHLAPQADDAVHVTLEGAALDEGGVAAYLDALEQTPACTGVRLVSSRAARAQAHYRDVPVPDVLLTRFEILVILAAPADTADA